MNAGDYSRFTFDPHDNVRTVMIQQGRPLTDADLNEASEATLRRIETENIDVVGAQGAPLSGGGFRIVQDATKLSPTELADPRNQPSASANPQNQPFVITAGRYYIHGLQIENHGICGPVAPTGPSRYPSQPMPLPAGALSGSGSRLVFLRAVIDSVTSVEWPRLLDPGLGEAGPSNRAVVSWQVGVMDAGAATACSDAVAGWSETVAPSTGRMIVSLDTSTPSKDPCRLTPGGGYVRPENLLYRIQVDDGIAVRTCADGPRFQRAGLRLKVSRNNAMEVARITKLVGKNLTVTPSSRDGLPTFEAGSWVEFLEDGAEARGDAWTGWAQVVESRGDVLTLSDTTGAALGDRVRLWSFDRMTVLANPADAVAIEDGISVRFPAGGEFRRGDAWLIPARYAVGPEYWSRLIDREWPPFGPRVEYARLAILALNAGTVQSISDCRPTFESLTQQLGFQYAGGDGQSVSPVGVAAGTFAAAPTPLRAGVRLGRQPVAGAVVRFELWPAPAAPTSGLLSRTGPGVGPAQGTMVQAITGADGIAAVTWSLNLTDSVQHVRASLLDVDNPSGTANIPVPIEYSASLNRASLVGYTPGACAGLAGIDQVQGALDKLCNDIAAIAAPTIPFMFVKEVRARGPQLPLINNRTIDPRLLNEGIVVTFSEDLAMNVQGFEPLLQFWIDLPYPPEPTSRDLWKQFMSANASAFIGTIPLTMTGTLSIAGPELHWLPSVMSKQFLERASKHRFGILPPQAGGPVPDFEGQPIKAYLTVRGDSVWSMRQDPRLYLNGEVLMFDDGQNAFSNDPQDFDIQRAADFRMWFFLEF